MFKQHLILLSSLNGRELNKSCGVSSICNSLHIELHLICSFVCAFCHPCFIKPDMHHTCCASCHVHVVVVYYIVCFLSGVASSGWFRLRRDCEDPFIYVRLSSSWTRSSSLRDLRQDDHTLEITSIFAW